MTTKLKPCPFCGGKAQVSEFFDPARYRVGCNSVKCEVFPVTKFYHLKKYAIEIWNTRRRKE